VVVRADQEGGVALVDVQGDQAGEGCADLIHRGSPWAPPKCEVV
jgi:hypothetical protein